MGTRHLLTASPPRAHVTTAHRPPDDSERRPLSPWRDLRTAARHRHRVGPCGPCGPVTIPDRWSLAPVSSPHDPPASPRTTESRIKRSSIWSGGWPGGTTRHRPKSPSPGRLVGGDGTRPADGGCDAVDVVVCTFSLCAILDDRGPWRRWPGWCAPAVCCWQTTSRQRPGRCVRCSGSSSWSPPIGQPAD